MAEQRKEEIYHVGQAKRMPMRYICDAADLLASEQYRVHNFFTTVKHPVVGDLQYPGMPMRWGDEVWDDRAAPLLGQHNRAVYCELLDYSEQDLVLLRSARII
jgi:crotonobetainyl-CoA:carnitine CoA-transferase CaiB-like acyl-CoA transferase